MSCRNLLRHGLRGTCALLLAALWGLGGCGGGADSRQKCTNSTECASDESCEAGVCLPACTPGVDCPEKDGTSDDTGDTADGDGADGGSDAEDPDISADGEDDGDAEDGGPDVTPEEELACESDRALATYDEGRAFEVRFGERSTGVIALPEGWTVEPACCGPGCCQ